VWKEAKVQYAGEQEYESLVDAIDAIIVEAEVGTFRINFINKAAEEILGYPRERWLNEQGFWLDHLHPDDRGRAADAKRQVAERREKNTFEYRMIAVDGRVVWFRDVVSPSVNNAENSLRVRGVMVDITDLKQAEAENQKLLHDLTKRVKELTALHTAARALERADAGIVQTLRQIAELLPPAFQHPEIAAARVRLGDIEMKTPGFSGSAPSLRADFTTANWQAGSIQSGSIEVAYTEDLPLGAGGRFLPEEQALLNTLADMLRIFYDQRRGEEQLRAARDQLRALAAALNSAKEREAIRIAREIHDEVGASLTSLKWDLQQLDSTIAESVPDGPVLRKKLESMLKLADTAGSVVRRIASELRPGVLDDLGLAAAIEWQAQQFQDRAGIICNYTCSEDLPLTEDQSTAFFRIFQEALTNILRHANATKVDITLKQESDELILKIADNGRGITEEEKLGQRSLGLLGMRERAHLTGARIDISGLPGRGTTLIVRARTAAVSS
jgi:PAS domain S-box-containing protein